MGQCRGLCLLQMGEAGHISVGVLLHQVEERREKAGYMPADLHGLAPCIQFHIERDLVVAAPAGVELLARVADPVDQIGFHKAVDILVLVRDRKGPVLYIREDPFQSLDDLTGFIRRDDTLRAEHLRVRDTAGDILSVQALVESDGIVKSLHGFIGLFGESAAPKLCHLKTSVIESAGSRFLRRLGGQAANAGK